LSGSVGADTNEFWRSQRADKDIKIAVLQNSCSNSQIISIKTDIGKIYKNNTKKGVELYGNYTTGEERRKPV
jgi:hypothetical protein